MGGDPVAYRVLWVDRDELRRMYPERSGTLTVTGIDGSGEGTHVVTEADIDPSITWTDRTAEFLGLFDDERPPCAECLAVGSSGCRACGI